MFWRTILSLPLGQEVMAADATKTMLYDYMVSEANHDINLHHHENLNPV